MREAFVAQRRLDCDTVAQVQLNLDCRSEIVPILRALQHLYRQRRLLEEILELVGQDVNPQSRRKGGRRGTAYWQIAVLAAVCLGCNLETTTPCGTSRSSIARCGRSLGLGDWLGDWLGEAFDWRRIRENLCKLRPRTIERIGRQRGAQRPAGAKLAEELG